MLSFFTLVYNGYVDNPVMEQQLFQSKQKGVSKEAS